MSKLWNDADTAKLVRLHASGMRMIDISQAMDMSVCKVRGRLTRLGVVGGKKARRLKGKPPKKRSPVGGSWDSRVFAPYAQWKIEHQQRRIGNVEV